MNPIIQQLLADGPVVTDGAWGTQFQAEGLGLGDCPDLWNLTEPSRVRALARSYVKAGSRIILTNTFGSNRINLARHGLAEKTVQINRRGVEHSRHEANSSALVFGSMGPSGKMLQSDEVSKEQLRAAFTEQAKALAAAGVDGLVIETMTDLEEAMIATRAAKKCGIPVVACMAFDTGKDKDRTMMGVTPEQAARELTEIGADVIGANCGQGIEGFQSICSRLRAATHLPIWIKPNAGLPSLSHGHAIYTTTPEQFARHVSDLIEAGASFVGGCCGTGPEFISAIGRTLSGMSVAV
jgi:methionine synthase I (cobalamin-dependent)